MIVKVAISSFKSLANVEIELGQLNVFVGANGSGKSNFLEAVGVLSAAADGKVTDQTLLQHGVRPGVPKLYKSAFPSAERRSPHIHFSGSSADAHYDVTLNNPLNDPSPAWKFKTERLERGQTRLASRGPNLRNNPNTENGLAALKVTELKDDDPALRANATTPELRDLHSHNSSAQGSCSRNSASPTTGSVWRSLARSCSRTSGRTLQL